ncbi:WhiB family transcriptional regulator [Streptomyces sp. NPDC093097]|uniref:WhiB family transcriptional regulator n=1 Tax=Streptomyces sp. NPDC093097 TaxID=3366027 RepID=UPI003814B0F7
MNTPSIPDFLGDATTPCAHADADFYATDTAGQDEAKAVCLGCPLRPACLDYALTNDERFGVWGGLTARERSRLRHDAGRWVDDEGRLRLACGTGPALAAHRAYRETCEMCQGAQAARTEAARRGRLAAEHEKGGTVRGYGLHRLLGEPACAGCLAAQARQSAEQRAARKDGGAVVPLKQRRRRPAAAAPSTASTPGAA